MKKQTAAILCAFSLVFGTSGCTFNVLPDLGNDRVPDSDTSDSGKKESSGNGGENGSGEESSLPFVQKQLPYEWVIDPEIEADDMIVSDSRTDKYPLWNTVQTEKPSDRYSIMKRGDEYSFIDYSGAVYGERSYPSYGMMDYGELVLTDFSDTENPEYCMASYDAGGDCKVETVQNFFGRGSAGWDDFVYGSGSVKIEGPGNQSLYGPFYNEVTLPLWGENTDRAVVVREEKGTKFGCFCDGRLTVELNYDDGFMSFLNDISVLKSGDEWVYFNSRTGERLIGEACRGAYEKYDGTLLPYLFNDGFCAVYTDSGCAYYDESGKCIIPAGTFEEARPVRKGLAWVRKDGKWGVIRITADRSENESVVDNPGIFKTQSYSWVKEPYLDAEEVSVLYRYQPDLKADAADQFDLDYRSSGEYVDCDYVPVKVGGKWGLLSYDGETVLDFSYDNIVCGFRGLTIGYNDTMEADKLVEMSDGTVAAGEEVSAHDATGTNGRAYLMWVDENNSLYSSGTAKIYDEDRPTAAILAVLKNGFPSPDVDIYTTPTKTKYVIVSDGHRITDEDYEAAGNYCDGIIPVYKDGYWGYVDENGNTVIPFEYSGAYIESYRLLGTRETTAFNASDGYVVLCKNSDMALYSASGKEVIPFGEFEKIRPVHDGRAWVRKDGKWGIIELN